MGKIMASSFNIVDSAGTEDIVISNANYHFARPSEIEPATGDLMRALELSSVLQSTLDVETLFHLFTREAQKSVSFSGLIYYNKEFDLRFESGRSAKHQCHYRLLVGSQKLGELRLFRLKKFAEAETVTIEYLLSSLLYPLRNTILYHHALRSAMQDPLTGVNNRAAFESTLQREIDLARRHITPLAVLMADIDHFKQINDEFGHLYGDCVLREVAQRIQRCVRRTDIVFRYGGEEFAIILSNTSPEGAHLTAERIRFAVAKAGQFKKDDEPQTAVTVSLGGSSLREQDTPETLFKRADQALYQAKNGGRNCVCFESP